MPPSAASRRPGLSRQAPGKAPRTCPKSSLSRRCSARQPPLNALHDVDHEEAQRVEDEHCEGVGLPGHPLVRTDAGRPIEEPLQRSEHGVEQRTLALIDTRHVDAERVREREEDGEVEQGLQDVVHRHQNHSGLSIAMNK